MKQVSRKKTITASDEFAKKKKKKSKLQDLTRSNNR